MYELQYDMHFVCVVLTVESLVFLSVVLLHFQNAFSAYLLLLLVSQGIQTPSSRRVMALCAFTHKGINLRDKKKSYYCTVFSMEFVIEMIPK